MNIQQRSAGISSQLKNASKPDYNLGLIGNRKALHLVWYFFDFFVLSLSSKLS